MQRIIEKIGEPKTVIRHHRCYSHLHFGDGLTNIWIAEFRLFSKQSDLAVEAGGTGECIAAATAKVEIRR